MVDFILKREIGQYVIEYYVPSMLLVTLVKSYEEENRKSYIEGDDELGVFLVGSKCCSWANNTGNFHMANFYNFNKKHRV